MRAATSPGIDTIRVEGVWDVVMFVPRMLYLGILGPLYNAVVAPNVDRFVWGTAMAQFHGNDRGGVRLAAVWNGPMSNAPAHGLPETVDGLLVAEADRHAADVLRQLRALSDRPRRRPPTSPHSRASSEASSPRRD